MERLTAFLHFSGNCKSFESEVRLHLRASGVEIYAQDQSTAEADSVVCFADVDELLIERVQIERPRAGSNILALAATADSARSTAIWRLLSAGASDVLVWRDPVQVCQQIRAKLERWIKVRRLITEVCPRERLAGNSPRWRTLLMRLAEAAYFSSNPILLIGESGTGKELLARLVHSFRGSSNGRSDPPDLVTVDCSTIVPELSGSELFGHERGAFTGAGNAREGAFALADGSTLFLDGIGELPLSLQTHLLRAVQEGTYKRVGGNVWQTTSFRLVCATNRSLDQLVAERRFRLDLYRRIAGSVFVIPPLKERLEDILPLAKHFLEAIGREEHSPGFDSAVHEYLLNREYPGNVRELRQLVHRMAHRHAGPGPITVGDIPEEDRPAHTADQLAWPDSTLEESIAKAVTLGRGLREIAHIATETAIRIAVQSEAGSLQRAARRLGITDRALQMRRALGKGLP